MIGAGPIGIIIALCAKQRVGEVYIAEINEKRAALARSLGIDCLEIGKNQLDECLRVTDGCGFDAVIEASGSKAGILLTTDACKIGGTIVPMSLSGAPVEFVLGKVSFKEQTVVGSRVYTYRALCRGSRNARHNRRLDRILTVLSAISCRCPKRSARSK